MDKKNYEELSPTRYSDEKKGIERDNENDETLDVLNKEKNIKNIIQLEISTSEYDELENKKDIGKVKKKVGTDENKKKEKYTKGRKKT